MALIMYFTRAPRYEGVDAEDIKLIESYLNWQREIAIGSKYASKTFEQWCGHSETELPDKNIIDYYKSNFDTHIGLFEELAKLVKQNHIFNWVVQNITHGKLDNSHYELTESQLNKLLEACEKVEDGFTPIGINQYTHENEYEVDSSIAKEILPLMEKKGYFFGLSTYNNSYAQAVINTAEIIRNILDTTDFDKQTVYFNAIW